MPAIRHLAESDRYDAHGHRIDAHTAPGQYNEARYWPVYTRDGTLRGEYRPASGVGSGPNDQYYYLGNQHVGRVSTRRRETAACGYACRRVNTRPTASPPLSPAAAARRTWRGC
jgi:hypothetical protein